MWGTIIGVIKGDTRSLDKGSYTGSLCVCSLRNVGLSCLRFVSWERRTGPCSGPCISRNHLGVETH